MSDSPPLAMTVPNIVLPVTTPQPKGQLRIGTTVGLPWACAPVTGESQQQGGGNAQKAANEYSSQHG